MLEIKVTGEQVAAVEGGQTVGTLTFSRAEERMRIETVDFGGDVTVADGLIRTALHWGENHGVSRVDFAPAVDRDMLRLLYQGAADDGIDDVSFFFQTCKCCGNIHGI